MEAELGDLRDRLDAGPDFVLLTPTYPLRWQPGGEFIRTRVRAYADAGLRGVVVHHGAQERETATVEDRTESAVARVRPSQLPDVIALLAAHPVPVLSHSPTPALQHLLLDELPGRRVAVWFHGYEVRDHRRLHHNHTTHEQMSLRVGRDQLNADRFDAARRVFSDADVTKVFVSEFQARTSQLDVGARLLRHEVIPNHIDTDTYVGRVRRPDEAGSILLMRGFSARNYGNDIAVQALRHLSKRPGFEELRVTVRGFGTHFTENAAVLRHLSGVTLQERYSSPAEMAALHHDHGIFLCPSRWDTHGVMLAEAMASGMVCITNDVAAIPEFTDHHSSILVRPDDPLAFAEALQYVIDHPEVVPGISAAAVARVREQCGRSATIDREIALVRGLGS